MDRCQYLKTLEYIPRPCLVNIATYLDIEHLIILMKTSEILKNRIEHEVFPTFKSILLSFSPYYQCYAEPGMVRFQFYPEYHETKFKLFLNQYESVKLLLTQQYDEVEIIIDSESYIGDRINIVEEFLASISVYGRILKIRLMFKDMYYHFQYHPKLFNRLPLVKSKLTSVKQLTLDINAFVIEAEHIILSSFEEIFKLPLNLFRLNVTQLNNFIKEQFEYLAKRKPECKFELGYTRYDHFADYEDNNNFTRFSNLVNITVLDLIQYDYEYYFYEYSTKRMYIDSSFLDQLIRYLPHLKTLKISVQECSTYEWACTFQQMRSLTKLELMYWSFKLGYIVMNSNHYNPSFIPLSNIQHLTLYLNDEWHYDVKKLFTRIKFPSLKTLKILPIKWNIDRCARCCGSNGYDSWIVLIK
ncbi:hypothetical protein BLOT_016839, partial [Blomia tropicalis]